MRGQRARPTYAIPASDERQVGSYYPANNRRLLKNGAVLAWKLGGWHRPAPDFDAVKMRDVQAAVFENDRCVCYFEIAQSRNASHRMMSVADEFFWACDAESQTTADHASYVGLALTKLFGRESLWPQECATELSRLHIPEDQRGSRRWPEAMLSLLTYLAKINNGPMVCILQAAPLEIAWRRHQLNDVDFSKGERPKELSAVEDRLYARRKAALISLYERELGFAVLKGQWMYRRVDPVDRGGLKASAANARKRSATA